MQKTTGGIMLAWEFHVLVKGDVYFVTDKGECRTFERFAKCYSHPKKKEGPVAKAVNTLGHVNPIKDMRWPTAREYEAYQKAQGLPIMIDGIGTYIQPPKASAAKVSSENWTSPQTKQTTKENTAMSKCSSVSEALTVVKADTVDAAWRTAAKETIRSVRAPLSLFLEKQNLPGGVVGFVLNSLDTDAGESVLAFVLGNTMTYVPKFACDAKLMRLAKELRVLGLEHFTTKIADALLNPLRAQLVEIVGALPFGEDK